MIKKKGQDESCFEINPLYGMLKSALNGYGTVELPNYTSITESGLKEVLPRIKGRDMPLYYSFLKAWAHSKKNNLLFNYLSKED